MKIQKFSNLDTFIIKFVKLFDCEFECYDNSYNKNSKIFLEMIGKEKAGIF